MTVLVNPADPHDAVVEIGAAGSGAVGAAFAVFGLIGVAAGAFLLSR